MKYDSRQLRDSLVGEYVLGTLAGAARRRFERLMKADPALERAVQTFSDRLDALGADSPPVAPPASLKAAVLERIIDRAAHLLTVVRAGDTDWITIAPGLERKILKAALAPGGGSALYRLAPGCELDSHDHPWEEECYIIDGDLTLGDMRLVAGDYFHVVPGGNHGRIRSRNGALLYIRGEVA